MTCKNPKSQNGELGQSAHIVEIQKGLFAATDDNGLDRLRGRGVPYLGLIKVAGDSMPPISPSDPYRQSLEGKTDAALTQRLNRLKDQGMEVLWRYRTVLGD